MVAFWALIAIYVATFVIKRLLTQHPERQDGKLDFPSVEEGMPIPLVFGTQEVAPRIVWYGNVGKGSTSHPVWYARVHAIVCWGPVDALHAVNFDKRLSAVSHPSLSGPPFWRAGATDDVFTRFDIYSPTLFGGIDQEGGAWGPIVWWWGEQGSIGFGTQESEILTGLYDDGYDPDGPGGAAPLDPADYAPRYPGLCQVLFGRGSGDGVPFSVDAGVELFAWSRNSPYAKPVTLVVSRFPNPPALGLAAADPLTPGLDSDINLGGGCNPVAALYELLTHELYGVGVPESRLDATVWTAAAQVLVTEGFGLSFTLHDASSAAAAIEDILTHIDAVLRENPRTGFIEVKLIRDDYVIGNLPVIDQTNASEMRISRGFWPETFNEVRVKFNEMLNTADRIGSIEATVTAQNLANWQATGQPRTEEIEYHMVADPALAAIIAKRRLRVGSLPLAKASWRMNREGFDLMRGDPVRVTWAPAGIDQLVMRIASIDYGTADDRSIQIDAIEDVFGVDDSVYGAPPATGWTTPTVDPIADTPPAS